MTQAFAIQPEYDRPERAEQIQHAFFKAVSGLNVPRAEHWLQAGADVDAVFDVKAMVGGVTSWLPRLPWRRGQQKPDARNEGGGQSPLMRATVLWPGNPVQAERMMDFLLAHGADPNTADPLGNRPLHVAAHWPGDGRVQKLLTHGADPRLKNNEGKTAEEIARYFDDALRSTAGGYTPHQAIAQTLEAHSERLTLAEQLPMAEVQAPRRMRL